MSNFNVSYNAGGTVDKIKQINELQKVNNVNEVKVVGEIKHLGGIQGFATKTQPYSTMIKIDAPASIELISEEIQLPEKEVEVLAITVTCSGYGEDDYYDLWFNDNLWFDKWYCSEVKDGLFLGSSTYVYLAPANSKIRINFHNTSRTSKKVWVGVRMLVDKDEQEEINSERK